VLGLSLAAPAAAEDTDSDGSGREPAGRSAATDRAESTAPAATQRSAGQARETSRRAARPGTPQPAPDEAATGIQAENAERTAAAVAARVAAPRSTDTGQARLPARESRRTAADSGPGSARVSATRSDTATAAPAASPVAPPSFEAPGPADVVVSLPPAAVSSPVASAVASAVATGAEAPQVEADAPATSAPLRARSAATVGIPAGSAAATSVADLFTGLVAPIQSLIEGVGLLIRRTFFNQAPRVNPVQTTGQTEGPITGTIGAVDPEGEQIAYQVTGAPQYGGVVIGAGGEFTYTPGPSFSGLDSFTVAAADIPGGFNLFDLGRPAATQAYVQIAQNATLPMLTFSFVYGSGSQYWSADARAALQSAAMSLAQYLVVTTPTTLTYDVTAERSSFSSTLASAGSDLVDYRAGFHPTVVQQKILTGIDANGSAADGELSWNFGSPWALGATVSNSQYDFTSTAMHELMHTLGFLSYTERAGANTGRSWTVYDSFLVSPAGVPVIGSDYRWQTAYNYNLTGGNGGLFFGGPNAVAVYGGLVPLYTPSPWESGSSVSHLDDDSFIGANTAMMNAYSDTGLGVRVLSPVELAILQDLGYDVSPSPLAALVLLGFGLVRRPRLYRPLI